MFTIPVSGTDFQNTGLLTAPAKLEVHRSSDNPRYMQ